MNRNFSLLAALIISAWMVSPTATQAGLAFIGNGNVILNANGGGNSFYAVDSYNSPTYNGNLGGLSINDGQSLLLGGQVQTWPGGGNFDGADSAAINYLVVGTSISGSLNLPFAYNVGGSPPNDVWEQSTTANMVNLDQGLAANQTYTLDIWFSAVANDNGLTYTDGSSGSPYSATFSVVPEPVTWAWCIFAPLVASGLLMRHRSHLWKIAGY